MTVNLNNEWKLATRFNDEENVINLGNHEFKNFLFFFRQMAFFLGFCTLLVVIYAQNDFLSEFGVLGVDTSLSTGNIFFEGKMTLNLPAVGMVQSDMVCTKAIK